MSASRPEKLNSFLYLFGKTWLYSAGNRRNVVLYWTLFVVAMSLSLFCQPLLGARIMDIIQAKGINNESLGALLKLLLLMFLIRLVFWVFHGPARVLEMTNSFKARANYRKHLLKGVMTLPMEWHVEHHSGDTIDKVEKGSSGLFYFSEDSFQVVYSIVELLGSFIMLAYFSPSSIPIVLAMLCFSIWITVRFDRVMIPQYRELNKAENQISENVFDTISNISTVIILRVERLVFQAISHRIDKPYSLFRQNAVLNESKWFLTTVCTSAMTALVLGVYFWQHLQSEKGILIGTVYILTKYLDQMGEIFFRFAAMYSDVVVRRSRIQNAEELAKEFKLESFTNHVLPINWQRLEVRDLVFSYHTEMTDLHLNGVNFAFTKGERIAFVGESGSGKTTLLKIMRNLYLPQGLSLLVDGQEIKDGFGGISRAIALVPQNPEIFSTTIRENITLGAEYEEAFIRRFTDMASFTEVLEALPKKFDSSIKEKGVNLSGGQQQRLALARGLLACHDKEIILLDEPTSSLDVGTEMKIYQNIFREFDGKTVISSIHRLHLLSLFDQIIFFDQGKILAVGKLEDLISACPKFQAVWQQYSQ